MLRTMFMDLKFINNLSDKASLVYWKMHIKSDLNILFEYY